MVYMISVKAGPMTDQIQNHPWRYRHADKDGVSDDSPSLNLDLVHILLSLAVEKRRIAREMDVKSAYSQAAGFNRDIYARHCTKKMEVRD